MSNVQISIIIPAYNAEKTIKETLSSIVEQSFHSYEVIIVNDGSKDETSSICKEYLSDSRFHLIEQSNFGVSVARNAGIDMAMGKYIVFVDADDLLDKNYLQVLSNCVENNGCQMGICGIKVNGKNIVENTDMTPVGKINRIQTARGLYNRRSYRAYLFNKIFLRSIINDFHIRFDTSAHMCEDSLFCTEYVKHIESAFFVLDPLYDYVQVSTSATNSKFNKKRFSVLTIYKQIMSEAQFFEDAIIERELKINYMAHNILLFRMCRDNKYYAEEFQTISAYMKDNRSMIADRDLPIKLKLELLFDELLLAIRAV